MNRTSQIAYIKAHIDTADDLTISRVYSLTSGGDLATKAKRPTPHARRPRQRQACGESVMLIPRNCVEIGPQCPIGQERGYKLGWYQGQIAMADEHDGTPCQIIAMQNDFAALATAARNALEYANPENDTTGAMADLQAALDAFEGGE